MESKIPESFLEDCMILSEGRAKDVDEITEDLVEDMPDCGEWVNSVIYSAVKAVVETYIQPKVEEYAEDYFEPSAREEALEDIRRETMEKLRNESR